MNLLAISIDENGNSAYMGQMATSSSQKLTSLLLLASLGISFATLSAVAAPATMKAKTRGIPEKESVGRRATKKVLAACEKEVEPETLEPVPASWLLSTIFGKNLTEGRNGVGAVAEVIEQLTGRVLTSNMVSLREFVSVNLKHGKALLRAEIFKQYPVFKESLSRKGTRDLRFWASEVKRFEKKFPKGLLLQMMGNRRLKTYHRLMDQMNDGADWSVNEGGH